MAAQLSRRGGTRKDPGSGEQGVRWVLQRLLRLRSGYHLLVVTDEGHPAEVDCILRAAHSIGAHVRVLIVPSAEQRSFCRSWGTGPVERAVLEKCNGLVVLTEYSAETTDFRMDILNSFCQTATRASAVSMPGVRVEHFPLLQADARQVSKSSKKVAARLAAAERIRIQTTSVDGVQHTLSVFKGRAVPMQDSVVLREHEWGNAPAGEVFFLPSRRSARGSVVLTGSIPGLPLRERSGEVILRITNGRVVSVDGPSEECRDACRKLFFSDYTTRKLVGRNSATLCEIGFGTNRAVAGFVGVPTIDEKAYGTVHLGFGRNT